MDNKDIRVLVVKGGVSSEREVSLESGGAVANALREGGYDVREYDIKEFTLTQEMLSWAHVVFPVLHGGEGEGGALQEMFEKANIAFVASGSESCRLIMDKGASKKVMDEKGIPNAKWEIITSKDAPVPGNLSFPMIVKPVSEGSTFGIRVVHNESEWSEALAFSFRYGNEILAEEFFKGVETTVGILDGEALPVIEIQFESEIYDYDAKYEHKISDTKYLCPPETLSLALQDKIRKAALDFYKVTGARDILRVDVLADPVKDAICVLEGNTIPGCTANSLVPKAAKAAGISFPELCSRLVRSAYKRKFV